LVLPTDSLPLKKQRQLKQAQDRLKNKKIKN
jgi:hypothetical protein